MIRMAKGLQHRLLAIALYITVIYGYVKSGRGGIRPSLHTSFLIIPEAYSHTEYSTPHKPAPNFELYWSSVSLLQMSLNTRLSAMLYRSEIRFFGDLASDRWNLRIQWHWLCK